MRQPPQSPGNTQPLPSAAFAALGGYLAFYPGRVEWNLGGERVGAQPGSYHGGWVTSEAVGPLKGGTDSGHW